MCGEIYRRLATAPFVSPSATSSETARSVLVRLSQPPALGQQPRRVLAGAGVLDQERRPAGERDRLDHRPGVTAEGVLCAFAACWTHCLNTVAASPPQSRSKSLVAAVLELNSYYVNAVQPHVHAADVLVSHGVDRDDFR